MFGGKDSSRRNYGKMLLGVCTEEGWIAEDLDERVFALGSGRYRRFVFVRELCIAWL